MPSGIIYSRSVWILCSHLCLGLPIGFFPSRFHTKILYVFLFCPMPCLSHPPNNCQVLNLCEFWWITLTQFLYNSLLICLFLSHIKCLVFFLSKTSNFIQVIRKCVCNLLKHSLDCERYKIIFCCLVDLFKEYKQFISQ